MENIREKYEREILKGKIEHLIDGFSFVSLWEDIIQNTNNHLIYISLSSFLQARETYGEMIKEIELQGAEALKTYIARNRFLAEGFLFSRGKEKSFREFMQNKKYYSGTYTLHTEKNIQVVLYKGFKIDLVDTLDTSDDIHPVLEEALAFASWRKSQGIPIELLTAEPILRDLFKNSNLGLQVNFMNLDKMYSNR